MNPISSSSSSLNAVADAQQSAVQSQLQFAVAAKHLQAAKEQGQAATELLQAAANLSKTLHTGKKFDSVG